MSQAKGFALDRSNIIFSASKGETGNNMNDLSLNDSKRMDDLTEAMVLSEMDLFAPGSMKLSSANKLTGRKTFRPVEPSTAG